MRHGTVRIVRQCTRSECAKDKAALDQPVERRTLKAYFKKNEVSRSGVGTAACGAAMYT